VIKAGGSGAPEEAPLANVFVYLETLAGPTGPTGETRGELNTASRFALAEGRRVARALGASVFAVLCGSPRPADEVDAVAKAAAAHGADKLLVVETEAAFPHPLDLAWGPALARLFERIPPALVLFPAGTAALELAPPLAARLGGSYAPRCEIQIDDFRQQGRVESRVLLHRLRHDERSMRTLDPLTRDHPIVATLGPGVAAPPRPAIEIGVETFSAVALGLFADTAELSTVEGDPWAGWPSAGLVVLVGPGHRDAAHPAAEEPRGRALAAAIEEELGPLLASGGGVVAAADDVPASVVAASTPHLVVKLGWSAVRLPSLPGTRLALVLEANDPEPPDDDCDMLFRLPAGVGIDLALAERLLAQLMSHGARAESWR